MAIGRTNRNITATKVTVRAATMAAFQSVAWATPTTSANRHHAVTSSTAAHVNAIIPSSVLLTPRSVRIRARTGNAVIDIATPMKSAKLVNGTSLVESWGYR